MNHYWRYSNMKLIGPAINSRWQVEGSFGRLATRQESEGGCASVTGLARSRLDLKWLPALQSRSCHYAKDPMMYCEYRATTCHTMNPPEGDVVDLVIYGVSRDALLTERP